MSHCWILNSGARDTVKCFWLFQKVTKRSVLLLELLFTESGARGSHYCECKMHDDDESGWQVPMDKCYKDGHSPYFIDPGWPLSILLHSDTATRLSFLAVSLFHLNVSERLSIIVLINDKGSNVLYSDRRQFSHLFLASFEEFSDEETNTHPRWVVS